MHGSILACAFFILLILSRIIGYEQDLQDLQDLQEKRASRMEAFFILRILFHDEQDKRLPFTYVFLFIPSRMFTIFTISRIRFLVHRGVFLNPVHRVFSC